MSGNLLLQLYRRPKNENSDNFLISLANEFDLVKAVANSKQKIKPDLPTFLVAHPTGKARIWAMGNNSNSESVFQKLDVDDLVLFHGGNQIYAYGYVASKTLWVGNDFIWPTGEDWKYIYSLKHFEEIPESKRINRDDPRQILPKVGHLSAFFVDLFDVGLTQTDVLNLLDTAPPSVSPHSNSSPARGPSQPPMLNESFPNRRAIWNAFGGLWAPSVTVFPGEIIVNVFSDDNGPNPNFIEPNTGVINFRGATIPLKARMSHENKLLEDAHVGRQAVRIWHRPLDGDYIFESWAVVADRTTVVEGELETKRIIWFLVPVISSEESSWSSEVQSALGSTLPSLEAEIPLNFDELRRQYKKLSQKIEDEEVVERTKEVTHRQYKRRKNARDLVIARSENTCEYTKCTGMPPDIGRNGLAILQVDHIIALSAGGLDAPRNMIALCPNCHAAKTYGRNATDLTRKFQLIVKKREESLES